MRRTTLIFGLCYGCEGSHGDLGVDDATASNAGHSSSAATSSRASSSVGAGGGKPIEEPDGPAQLTLVNGIVDRDWVQFCFSNDANPQLRAPIPAAGLPFGRSLVVPLASEDVPVVDPQGRVLVAAIAAKAAVPPVAESCATVLNDPSAYPNLSIVTFGTVPGDTFAMPRSLLMVSGGCLGGEGHEDPKQEAVCGSGYTKDLPTPTLLVGPMSRLFKPNRLSMQVAHGVAGVGEIAVKLQRGDGMNALFDISKSVAFGAVAPFPPAPIDLEVLGPLDAAQIQTALGDSPQPIASATVTLGTARISGALESNSFEDGRGVALVAVGAAPGLSAGAWWHAFTYVAVLSRP